MHQLSIRLLMDQTVGAVVEARHNRLEGMNIAVPTLRRSSPTLSASQALSLSQLRAQRSDSDPILEHNKSQRGVRTVPQVPTARLPSCVQSETIVRDELSARRQQHLARLDLSSFSSEAADRGGATGWDGCVGACEPLTHATKQEARG